MRLCPWSLASSIPVLGLERVCPRKGCPWPWPRIFLCPWPWPRALCPRLHLCHPSIQRLRIYSFFIRSAIWSGRALSLGTKVTASDKFHAGFKKLSFCQPVYTLFAADKKTNPEMAGPRAIENIHCVSLCYCRLHLPTLKFTYFFDEITFVNTSLFLLNLAQQTY